MGCGRRAPKRDLVRFAEVDGLLTPGTETPGRGAYTCRDVGCFELAASRRAFARTLRAPVRVEPGLARLYTEVSHG